MTRKKIDNRLRVMIEAGVASNHRSMFVIVGDKAKEQVVILHHLLTKSRVKARPSVLWCYKKELGFSSHRQKKMKKLQKKVSKGQLDVNQDDPFELFVASTDIRYCYYKDTHKILGNTYGMLVLQDFQAITPNLLARTIETIEGGGLVVLMLESVDSLKKLYTITMDVHSRFRTEAQGDVQYRFNERFILSLANNKRCAVIDDMLNVLPLSTHIKHLPHERTTDPNSLEGVEDPELKLVKEKFQDTQPTGCLLNLCKTLDQAKALLEFIDAIADKKLDRTVSLTAARGRGKSAALGVAIAAAVGFGYSNIFVTSPSPENLRTLFDFVFKAFDAMQYEEHTDYDLVQSTNPEFNQAVVRVNIHEEKNGGRRQTIQYLHPTDAHKLGQAELVVIDEAAAIPLPLVKGLFGPYLIFMASTINGYEGTGRSLSLKLLENLRQQQNPVIKAMSGKEVGKPLIARMLKEISLQESIRYKPGDAVEDWLNRLLCLDATVVQPLSSGCPAKEDCELYYINRDTLFCYHKASEAFLQRIMSLFVASHYKNTPNDLQLLSDAPGHHLFCLLGPVDPNSNSLPEVLCVIQVCLEGLISRDSILKGLSRGKRAAGDLIPWTMSQQFQDDNFPSLSGARVIRIATHPDYQRMGYGSRALELLQQYYEMKVPNIMEQSDLEAEKEIETVPEDDVGLLEEHIGPRKNLPPLLLKLSERKPEKLDYIGVSYGLTAELLRFWKRCGFTPTYIRQTANDLTGEHSTIMLKVLNPNQYDDTQSSDTWLPLFWNDFRRRFVNLLGFDFRKFSPAMALGVLSNRKLEKLQGKTGQQKMDEAGLSLIITPYDLKRLEQYGNNMADYHLIMDLMPNLAKIYFLYEVEGMDRCHLSALQQAILVGIGLQCKTADSLATELDLPTAQLLGLLNTMLRNLTKSLRAVQEKSIAKTLETRKTNGISQNEKMSPMAISLNSELEDAAKELKMKQMSELNKLKGHLDFQQYAIKGNDDQWNEALKIKDPSKVAKLISVKTGEKREKQEDTIEQNGHSISKKKKKDKDKSRKNKS